MDLDDFRKQIEQLTKKLEQFQRLKGAFIAKSRCDTSYQADFWHVSRVTVAKILAIARPEQNARVEPRKPQIRGSQPVNPSLAKPQIRGSPSRKFAPHRAAKPAPQQHSKICRLQMQSADFLSILKKQNNHITWRNGEFGLCFFQQFCAAACQFQLQGLWERRR